MLLVASLRRSVVSLLEGGELLMPEVIVESWCTRASTVAGGVEGVGRISAEVLAIVCY